MRMCWLRVGMSALSISLACPLTPMMAGDPEHVEFIGTLEIAGDAIDLSGDDKLFATSDY